MLAFSWRALIGYSAHKHRVLLQGGLEPTQALLRAARAGHGRVPPLAPS